MMCVLVSCGNFHNKYTPCYVNSDERKQSAAGKMGKDIKLQIIWWLGKINIRVRWSVLIFEKCDIWQPFGLNGAGEYHII